MSSNQCRTIWMYANELVSSTWSHCMSLRQCNVFWVPPVAQVWSSVLYLFVSRFRRFGLKATIKLSQMSKCWHRIRLLLLLWSEHVSKLVLGPVWPDLAKFRHFGTIFIVLGKFFEGLFSIWQNFDTTLAEMLCY